MNLSRVPPKASISRFSRTWKGRSVAFTSSGSARSDLAVKPTRSQNSTVTTLRSSTAGPAPAASEAPQYPQNWNPSGFSRPHDGHLTGEKSRPTPGGPPSGHLVTTSVMRR